MSARKVGRGSDTRQVHRRIHRDCGRRRNVGVGCCWPAQRPASWRCSQHRGWRSNCRTMPSLPITADNTDTNTRAQLARVNYLRDEPGGRRFFVNDLNGPLYILDKQTKAFTTYLDFNGLAGSRACSRSSRTRETSRPASPTSFSIRTMRGMACSTRSTWKTRPHPGLRSRVAGRARTRSVRIHDDAGGADADGQRPDRSRGRAGRVEGSQRREFHIRRDCPRATARAVSAGSASVGRDDVQPSRATGRSGLAGHVSGGWRFAVGRATRQPPSESAATRHARRQDPPHHPRPARAHEHERRQRERPLSDPERQPVHDGRRRTQGNLGVRPAQSSSAGLGRRPARPRTPTLLAFNIGLVTWETVDVIHRGANYGYPLREGTQSMSSTNGMGPLPDDDMIPIQISDTVARGTVKPTYPVIQYPHNRDSGGDAIANGFVYRGKLIPALRDKLVFGDITTGRIWYANRADVLAADDGNPTTVAPIYEIDAGLRRLTEETYRARGGKGEALPGMGAQAGRGRVDVRFARRQRRRALRPDQERRHDQESGGREDRDERRRPLSAAPRARSERQQPAGDQSHESRRGYARSRSPPGSGPTTPIALPVTATWRKARSKPA